MNYAGEVEWKTQEFWKKTNRKAIKRTACEKKNKSTKKKKTERSRQKWSKKSSQNKKIK